MENKKIIDYCVIEANIGKMGIDLAAFEAKIKAKIAGGWIPIGGVATIQQTIIGNVARYYTQTMIKYEQ